MPEARRLETERLVIASHNDGKVREINDLVAPFGMQAISAGALGLPEPEETGTTFIANAELKALAAATASGLPALADDSGLAVDALGGNPGIYSARWAVTDSGERDFHYAMQKVEQALSAIAEAPRTARFICALSLAWPDGHMESFEGKVEGSLVWPPRGDKGFGYDPVFVPEGGDHTFAEIEPETKHAMSHRADAFAQLIDACLGKTI
ncbi:MAG: RdgB/HAM1 family non-canonical purine NTP pyrophosphatase [Parvibaculales bacterium]